MHDLRHTAAFVLDIYTARPDVSASEGISEVLTLGSDEEPC